MGNLRPDDVLALRMASLLLDPRHARSPADIVEWFGAMQAQDLASGMWSFGVRNVGLRISDVEQAVVERQILRTWPMRGTVHFVPPKDAGWMLSVTGVRALAGAARRRAHLGLDEVTVTKAVDVLGGALAGGKSMTRAECVARLVHAGVHTAPEHGYHLLWYASQIGVTCMGPQQGKEQTFVLLDEWVPDPRRLDRDEALAELAIRYFRSHGPTTRHDFAGWTGLTMGDATRGIAGAGGALTHVACDGVDMWLSPSVLDPASSGGRDLREMPDDGVLLLPGFDEYILGFKDRSLMLSDEYKARIVPGGNGVFMPTLVHRGRVIGTWRREIKKGGAEIRLTSFAPLTPAQSAAIATSAVEYGRYLGVEATLLP